MSLLELAEYYSKTIEDFDKNKSIVRFYVTSAKCQLNYYITNFRNDLGLFINKKSIVDNSSKDNNKIMFTSKKQTFKFEPQAYLMTAFLKCSNLLKDNNPYKKPFFNFHKEIFKMFKENKQDIFKIETSKLINIASTFKDSYLITQDDEIITYIFDLLCEVLLNRSLSSTSLYDKFILYEILLYLSKNEHLFNLYKNDKDLNKIINSFLHDIELIFNDDDFIKDIENSKDIIAYLIYKSLYSNDSDIFKICSNLIVKSNIFSSFPDIPKKDSHERYYNFCMKKEFLIPEIYFKPKYVKSMSDTDIAPIINKISYNQSKNKFSKPKLKFESKLNMKLIFLILNTLSKKLSFNINN